MNYCVTHHPSAPVSQTRNVHSSGVQGTWHRTWEMVVSQGMNYEWIESLPSGNLTTCIPGIHVVWSLALEDLPQ